MNATVKFRDGQRPLFRLKLPVRVVGGLPLQTGVTVGSSEELCLQIGTSFDSGPSWHFKYSPNDGSAPSVILKTGLGKWGSSNATALSMSAEWDLRAGGGRFMVRLKPRIGDFSLCHTGFADYVKDQAGAAEVKVQTDLDSSAEDIRPDIAASEPEGAGGGQEAPRPPLGGDAGESLAMTPAAEESARAVNLPEEAAGGRILARRARGRRMWDARAWQVYVHSVLPLGQTARARARWSIHLPTDLFETRTPGVGALNLSHRPKLALDKVSVELLEGRRMTIEKRLRVAPGDPVPALPLRWWSLKALGTEVERVAAATQENAVAVQELLAANQRLEVAVEDLKAQLRSQGESVKSEKVSAPFLDAEESILRAQSGEVGWREAPKGDKQRKKRDGKQGKMTDCLEEPREADMGMEDTISQRLKEALAKRV